MKRFTDGRTYYCDQCQRDTYHDPDDNCYGIVCEDAAGYWEEVTYEELIAEIDLLIELDKKSEP